jgi:hypothetical protein
MKLILLFLITIVQHTINAQKPVTFSNIKPTKNRFFEAKPVSKTSGCISPFRYVINKDTSRKQLGDSIGCRTSGIRIVPSIKVECKVEKMPILGEDKNMPKDSTAIKTLEEVVVVGKFFKSTNCRRFIGCGLVGLKIETISTVKKENKLKKLETADVIKIYPNPTASTLNINWNIDITQMYIMDAQGRIIKLLNAQKQNILKVDVSSLPAGLYFVNYNKGGVINTKQFVVAR